MSPRPPGRSRAVLDGEVRVALVDDHPVVLDGVAAWLSAEDRLRVVATGDSVSAVLEACAQCPDVLLLDLNLHGDLVVGEVERLAGRGVRVVVYSQHAEPELVLAVMDAGASSFVAKHEGRGELVQAVLAAAADRPHVSPTTAGALAADQRPQRPRLSRRELEALLLWFQSMSRESVARRMGISPHTVKEYIDRARVKYAEVGRPAPTKSDMLARAIEDELIEADDVRGYRSWAARGR
ncbi:response regulator transcription factor [Allonocardiopsis opalescens]|uniref:response regulator transcription factor n=1 Tax=Allonocardiopsis opalescens TaxID=1144618 RepID=UPI001FE7FE5F|nr:response regulator transcription factor [Allonocardiopsis opalescens]